jgi:DnaK suppressor protein
MNATVTKTAKSAKKTAASSARAKPSAKKTPAKASVKALAGKVVKALAKPLKAAGKTAAPAKKTPTKSAVKSPKPAAKTAKPKTPAATRTSAAKTAKTPTKSAAQTKPAAKTAVRPAAKSTTPVRKTAAAAPEKNASRSGATSGKTVSRPMDNIEPSVSKAREVATKTSKASPAPAEGTLLTEEQILKMSDKDYMNEAQLAFFKNRLQQLEKDLLKNADETTEHLRETVLVPDPADRATIEEEHALELRTRDRERKLLKKVQQSIASIDSGDYGWCEETGEPIGVARLLARPTATLSLEAQQRRELKQKLYGD